MSSFSQRRGPNVSQYISNLNSISSNSKLSSTADSFALDENIKMFTNADFFDFELGNALEQAPLEFDAPHEGTMRRGSMNSVDDSHNILNEINEMDDINDITDINYNVADYPYENPFLVAGQPLIVPTNPHHPIYSPVAEQFNMNPFGPNVGYTSSTTPVTYPVAPTPKAAQPTSRNAAGNKRRMVVSPAALIEGTPEHAEEDKRRRNTAASARFRVKKKLKEQALEDTVKDATRRADAAEKKVEDLQKEVTFLRNLLLEGRSNKDTNEKASIEALLKEHKDLAE